MRFIVLGAGALGCIYGGLLAESGHDVTLVARGHNFAALKSSGLTVLMPTGRIKRQMKVVEHPADADPADVALLTVKSRDSDNILQHSKNLFNNTSFISFQNSGAKDEILAKYVGRFNTIGGASTIGATALQPGIVELTATGNTWLGELPQGSSSRVEELVKILNDAGISAETTEDITSIKWTKLIQFSVVAGLGCLTRLKWHQILQEPNLTKIFIYLVREGALVMEAVGVPPRDHRHLINIRKIVEMQDEELIREFAERGKQISRTAPTVVISMLQDLLRGKPLEVEETLGYLVRQAAEHDVAVPTWQTILTLLRGLDGAICSG